MRVERIGSCTLYLADSRDVLNGASIDCLVSDPPFGMTFRSNHRTVKHEAIANDCDDAMLKWACSLPVNHSAYIFARWDNLAALPKPKSLVTWVKNNWSMGDLEHEHGRQTEVCLFFPGPKHFFPSGRPSDVLRCPRTGNDNHPTEKPVPLMEAIIEWTDGVVVDPFAGSGSTCVAATRLGRASIGVELDPKHFDTACRRVEEAARSPRMFIERPPAPVQTGLDL